MQTDPTHSEFVTFLRSTFAHLDPAELARLRAAALDRLDAAQAALCALPWYAPADELAAREALRDAHVALVSVGVCAVVRRPYDEMGHGELLEGEIAHVTRALHDMEYLRRCEHDRIVAPWFPVLRDAA